MKRKLKINANHPPDMINNNSVLNNFLPEDGNEFIKDAKNESSKRANELDGSEWTKFSISIWDDIRKGPDEIKLGHPAIFPIALVKRFILSLTKKNERIILDPFAGIGTTIVAARELGRSGIGIELNEKFTNVANRRLAALQQDLFTNDGTGEGKIINGNSFNLLNYVEPESVDFVITSPPYWDILEQKRTADYKDIRNYGEEKGDLGKISDYREFLAELEKIFSLVFKVLKKGKYCVVVVMDIRKKDKFYPFHSDISTFMQEIGFILDDIIIWNRSSEYNNLRPLGYPYVFRVNKVHEFCLIFKKPT